MIIYGVHASEAPAKVVLENLPTGTTNVRLTGEVTEEPVEEGGVSYVYDEVVFELPEDRQETVESITENFAGWWEFGQQEFEDVTLEQRVSDLEDAITALLEG